MVNTSEVTPVVIEFLLYAVVILIYLIVFLVAILTTEHTVTTNVH